VFELLGVWKLNPPSSAISSIPDTLSNYVLGVSYNIPPGYTKQSAMQSDTIYDN